VNLLDIILVIFVQVASKSFTTTLRQCRHYTRYQKQPTLCAAATDAATPPRPAQSAESEKRSQFSGEVVVEEERLPNSHVKLTVRVPPELVRKSYGATLKKLSAETEVPGFRKGKKAGIPTCPPPVLIEQL
jgi:hypothetical protein